MRPIDLLHTLPVNSAYRLTNVGTTPVLSISGTQTIRDLLDDVNIQSTHWLTRDACVHAGFARAAERVMADEDVNTFLRTQPDAVICGYSLGGAVGVLVAARLRRVLDARPRRVVTFGTPPLGNDEFCRLYREMGLWDVTDRFAVRRDPVVYAPIAFRHVGKLHRLESRVPLLETHAYRTYEAALSDLDRAS